MRCARSTGWRDRISTSPRCRSTCRSTARSDPRAAARPTWHCSAWPCRPIRTSSTARTGSFPGPRPRRAQVLRESYIVFPTLTPFADLRGSVRRSGPTRSTARRSSSCSPGPAGQVPAPPALQLHAVPGTARRSALGALQIRDGSEQLLLGGRRLERGVDYTISYDLGQVTFLNPDALFGSGDGQITARFEEQGLFAVAPTTILGLSTRYSLGEVGRDQPHRDVPAGAECLQPAAAWLRGYRPI